MNTYHKICTQCKISKPFNDFGKDKYKKDGHCPKCKSCHKKYYQDNKKDILEKSKEYYQDNKEQIIENNKAWRNNNKESRKEYMKKYREDNAESLKEYSQKYYQDNKESLREYMKQYREDNKESINESRKKYLADNKEILNKKKQKYYKDNKNLLNKKKQKYRKIRRDSDSLYKLTCNIGSLIRIAIGNNGFTKQSRTHEILGCSYKEFYKHIESQFAEGMSWDNRSEWHLDHITPVSWGTTEEEIIALNHYTNFQPLWAIDNIKKGNRFSDD